MVSINAAIRMGLDLSQISTDSIQTIASFLHCRNCRFCGGTGKCPKIGDRLEVYCEDTGKSNTATYVGDHNCNATHYRFIRYDNCNENELKVIYDYEIENFAWPLILEHEEPLVRKVKKAHIKWCSRADPFPTWREKSTVTDFSDTQTLFGSAKWATRYKIALVDQIYKGRTPCDWNRPAGVESMKQACKRDSKIQSELRLALRELDDHILEMQKQLAAYDRTLQA